MNNFNFDNNSNLTSEYLQNKIDNFKNKFYNKPDYFVCKQDIVGIMIVKYFDNLNNFISLNFKKFKNNFLIRIYRINKKRSFEISKLLSKFEMLEQKLDNQQLILERSFNQNSKLQKEVDDIHNKMLNNLEGSNSNLKYKQHQIIGHNSNTKVDFYQEENLRLGSELVETKKKFEILKIEIEKYENQRSDLISKINSVNDVINDSNVLTNVFENQIQPKVNILDPKNIQKKENIDLNDKVKKIFSKKI